MRIRWRLIAPTLLALGQLSCAAGNLTPMHDSMPAARAGLLPEYRLFYDALQDYGDWVLIEPYGYLFRPNADMMSWRPYSSGFWAPTDAYGWVWISEEPFGWATYHYGKWFYDRFQGWVWMPGLDWGPAWVTWEQTPDYVGWSPQFPVGYTGSVPGGSYLYVPTSQLPATDLKVHLLTQGDVGAKLGVAKPVKDEDQRDGVSFNRGPSIAAIEKLTGPLDRVKIEDAVSATLAGAKPGASADSQLGATAPKPSEPTRPGGPRPTIDVLRQAGEDQAQQARWVSENKAPPPLKIEVFRKLRQQAEQPAPQAAEHKTSKRKAAATDSTHHH